MHPSTKPTSSSERRNYRRAELVVPVCIRTPSGDARGETRDVSTGGVGVAHVSGFEVGTAVEVDFDVDRTTVRVEAEVAWCRDGRAGLRFRSLDPGALATLADYIAR